MSILTVSTNQAIERGDLPTVQQWVQENVTSINRCKGGRACYLHFAVANGTALHWAVYYGKLEIAQLLLDNGAGI